jgi:hypothetical protein
MKYQGIYYFILYNNALFSVCFMVLWSQFGHNFYRRLISIYAAYRAIMVTINF